MINEIEIKNYQYEIEKERNKINPSWIYISYCFDRIRELKGGNK